MNTINLDESGRVTKTTFEGGTYTETGYDSLGRKAWERDQLGRQTDYTCDDAGHLTSVTLPSVWDAGRNQTSRPQYIYGYDAYGNMTSQPADARQDQLSTRIRRPNTKMPAPFPCFPARRVAAVIHGGREMDSRLLFAPLTGFCRPALAPPGSRPQSGPPC